MKILGLSAYYHDSDAALVLDGAIGAAAQEQPFSRKKLDARFTEGAINGCLLQDGITQADIDVVISYDKPIVKFECLLETLLTYTPQGIGFFVAVMPVWLKEKLYLKAVEFHRYTSDIEDIRSIDVCMVAAQSRIDWRKRQDLSPLIMVCDALGKVVGKDAVVIYESTIYPGSTGEGCVPIMEKQSGLACFNKEVLADAMDWYMAGLGVTH